VPHREACLEFLDKLKVNGCGLIGIVFALVLAGS